jgi:hypothetical protein
MSSSTSFLIISDMTPMVPPSMREPVSPINTSAGLLLYPEEPDAGTHHGECQNGDLAGPGAERGIARYSEKSTRPVRYAMPPKVSPTMMLKPVASPSNPSVRFTALVKPVSQNTPKGIKNQPISKTGFLNMGIYSRVVNSFRLKYRSSIMVVLTRS